MPQKLIFLFLLAGLSLTAQKQISVNDIWGTYQFIPGSVPGFNFQQDGVSFTKQDRTVINEYNLASGDLTRPILDAASLRDNPNYKGGLDGYRFSDSENKIILNENTESIYRYSTRADYYIYDREKGKLSSVFDGGKVRYATLDPAEEKVAFVHKNDLYYTDLSSGETTRVTSDGSENRIINGATDWVYEEEFALVTGFQWSPDGERIAYYRFDETEVPEFTMMNYRDEAYPEYVTFKYPKVGEKNSTVTLHIYDLKKGKSREIKTPAGPDIYYPRIHWTKDPEELIVFKMNRHQNELELLLVNAKNGKTETLLEEKSQWYVDVHDNLTFLDDGKHFVWSSEEDGYNHMYLYNLKGKQKEQLTKGKWDVTAFYGVDETNGEFYYQAAKEDPMTRHVYRANLKGKKHEQLTRETGTNNAQFSSNFDYYVNTHSTINTPPTYTVYDRSGKVIRRIEDNAKLRGTQQEYAVQPAEFFTFKNREGDVLNGYMIKPPNFKKRGNYPVFMYLYGGPGSQQVTDSWKGQNYWWFQMLAQQGYVVACVDNRGTGGRGEAFKKQTYLKLGELETRDQIDAAKYLGGLSYTDPERIGIFGWSYGGYMSSLCLLKGNDVFKAAIAVAPVTNWKWYDSIYTERYMRTPAENPDGYRDNSPVYFADRLKGNYLLIHGMGDDNVHFQNTAEMANALIMANKQFDTYFYPNRNHGIYGGPTRLHLYNKMTDFVLNKL